MKPIPPTPGNQTPPPREAPAMRITLSGLLIPAGTVSVSGILGTTPAEEEEPPRPRRRPLPGRARLRLVKR